MLEENKDKIEDIKMRLYDPNDRSMTHDREGVLHQVNHIVKEEWESKDTKEVNMNNKFKKPHKSVFKKFFIASIIFFIGALGFAFYKFYSNDVSVSNDKIDIVVIGNAFTKGGEELPLQIEITNRNNANLELANLIIEYPKGAEDNSTDMIRLPRDTIGTIRPGESVIRNVKVKLFGEEKSIRNVLVSLEYHPQGSNAIFTKDKYYPVTISLAPLSLIMDSPTTATSNQQISIKVTATLNTSLPNANSMLQITYPNNFIFDESIPSPSLGNSFWDLSSLNDNNSLTVELKGRLIGQDGDEQVFHAYAGETGEMNQSNIKVIYSSVLQKVLITKPFLEARILVNNLDLQEYAVSGGTKVDVSIPWANNLSTLIMDGQIIASLSGNAFDERTVETQNGFYDSVNNQIIWDRNSYSVLSEINPGEDGEVSFSLKTPSYVGLLNTIKDPQISIKVSIKGRQPEFGSNFSDINNFSEKIIKILTDFQVAPLATYISGSMPPKAETETTYMITWTLSNGTNNVSQAQARASLPIYIKWIGPTNNENENLSYNDVTREVVWSIGQVNPNTGISTSREASFYVSLKPSLSQVGSVPQLVKDIYLSGVDMFTNTQIKNTRNPITTMLINDPSFIPANARVVK